MREIERSKRERERDIEPNHQQNNDCTEKCLQVVLHFRMAWNLSCLKNMQIVFGQWHW